MKLILGLELLSEAVDLNYRESILSFIKHILSEKYPDDFIQLYTVPIMKSYSYSVYFPNAKLYENSIHTNKQMSVTITSCDKILIAKLYNAALFMKYKNYPMRDNSMTLKKVRLDTYIPKIKERNLVKFLSPLVIRKREDNKDTYLNFDDQEFNQYVNISIENLCNQLGITPCGTIKLTPFNAKRTVIKQDNLFFEANLGTFVLEGDKDIISLLYQTGIGSRRSQGFGMFEIIGG